jgi:hypothetical protein
MDTVSVPIYQGYDKLNDDLCVTHDQGYDLANR